MKIEYITPNIKAVLVPNTGCLCQSKIVGSSNEGFGDDGTGETELN